MGFRDDSWDLAEYRVDMATKDDAQGFEKLVVICQPARVKHEGVCYVALGLPILSSEPTRALSARGNSESKIWPSNSM